MRYDTEVIERITLPDSRSHAEFDVLIYQPHLDPDYTTIGLDTPDGRRHDLEPAAAVNLAHRLLAAPGVLETVLKDIETRRAAEDEEDDLD